MIESIAIQRVKGAAVQPYIPTLARLRIKVFREYPYLYDGDFDYESRYLATYANAPEALFVLAFDNDRVVGVATGVPMQYETDDVKQPFLQNGFHPENLFYFGESVLQAEYRGKGIGHRFFDERERYAHELNRFDYTCFCAVERDENDSRRLAHYRPLDGFWEKRGYEKHPELATTFSWKELGEIQETPKPMAFWLRPVDGA